MSDSIQFSFWLIGIPAILAGGWLVIIGVEWAAFKLESLAAHIHGRLTGWKTHDAEQSRQHSDTQAFRTWLSTQAGIDPMGSEVDERLVAAQQQTELIHVLLEEEIPKAVLRCCDTHRLMAGIVGASHMSEVAYESDCYKQRAMTVWLLGHADAFLESYPLRMEDARLLHNSVVLKKRALRTCRRCPYIRIPVDGAPTLCPTAELVQFQKRGAVHVP